MSRNGPVAQTTREAPSALMRESFIAPKRLLVCCICRKIRDETESSQDRNRWGTLRTYRQTHGVNLVVFRHCHTYCPPCFTKFMDTEAVHRETRSAP